MNRAFTTAAAVTALAFTLSACGGGGSSTAASTVTVTSTAAAPAAESWTVPDEVGKDLQTAQDDLQALTGNPAYISTSKDLTGQGRHQINDRNWQVCNSTPNPGATFTSQTHVVFGVVKNGESCP